MSHHQTTLMLPNPTTPTRSSSASSSPLPLIHAIFARKNLFYHRLPSLPLRLSVLKLDGSSFHIQVPKTATIAELKDAVEAVFAHAPLKGPAKISWAHVWGQFCLCYDGQKLVTEDDYLRNYGIKDGDELRFIRHVSNNCCVQRKRLKKRIVYLKPQRRCRSSPVDSYQDKRKSDSDEIGSDDEATDNEKYDTEEVEEERVVKNKFAGFMGELFSYTPLAVVRRTTTKSRIWPSTIPRCLVGSFRKIRSIVCFGRRRPYSRRLTWRHMG
ncbi:uncharacterized protein LOC106764622 isoform X1 [Vigna radiata var. radiata]|uniref:Uncharacterized protein LOC106764622 isoform X1 n=1 Tax=Vigna radiata var. radiata TaxID=3916 RepID=A0A1S3UED3_VIGRR|nr:uncharacterized protein LOC106764622 isoform X1 [Vigna radiata var. radiata]